MHPNCALAALKGASPPLVRPLTRCQNAGPSDTLLGVAASTAVAVRTSKGQFVKGVSGNPGGRITPSKQIREYARRFDTEAIDLLMDMGRNPELQPMARVRALELVLNRGHGVPAPDTSGLEQLLDGGMRVVRFKLGEAELAAIPADETEALPAIEGAAVDAAGEPS
jgi:hypothetical protein